jgi:hypothetical protein
MQLQHQSQQMPQQVVQPQPRADGGEPLQQLQQQTMMPQLLLPGMLQALPMPAMPTWDQSPGQQQQQQQQQPELPPPTPEQFQPTQQPAEVMAVI